MPPHHLILFLLGAVGIPTFITLFSILHLQPQGQAAGKSGSETSKSGIRALFSFHTPSTLFPPSAIISLTDDNSTFFLARPADFGPPLLSHGLSGELWIGSGFGDENIGRGVSSGSQGELGCSDVPGWDDGSQQSTVTQKHIEVNKNKADVGQANNPGTILADAASSQDSEPSQDDGTDDHLHHPLPSSPVTKSSESGKSAQRQPPENGQSVTHADIQSLQESAEIAGKVVLLSRGGCGFLEKVKWAQRRGGVALIVGDHTRGGPLITMYARGDTSNVTIPSLFTSYTTAHLLSSLVPPENILDDVEYADESLAATGKAQMKPNDDRPTFTSIVAPKSTSALLHNGKGRNDKFTRTLGGSNIRPRASWSSSFITWLGIGGKRSLKGRMEDTRRPPSSGRLDWLSEKWTDDLPLEKVTSSKTRDNIKEKTKTRIEPTSKETRKAALHPGLGDDFVIGVQDWRDPDLVAAKASTARTKSTTTTRATAQTPVASKVSGKGSDSMDQKFDNALAGGSITPGSGQYNKPGHNVESSGDIYEVLAKSQGKNIIEDTGDNHVIAKGPYFGYPEDDLDEEHEGLWVTLTPTTMSTSPFFDTLLVLVVSPLVTLTVVYALLLLRSRIRRRRWRAPKSVVDRLPIRTYHTLSCTASTTSTTPRTSSPSSPLLQSSPRSSTTRSRPRSATASGIGDALSGSLDGTKVHTEKGQVKAKRKYAGRQVECVVCLEEYVDGQSKVMSLPCGHEFHAECITPWLTTRRRTCPICKGDVVRSLAQPPAPAPTPTLATQQPYHDDPDLGDVQVQAAETTNESPTAAIPIPTNDADLERGVDMAATLVNDEPQSLSSGSGWRGLASFSLGAFTGEATSPGDRNR